VTVAVARNAHPFDFGQLLCGDPLEQALSNHRHAVGAVPERLALEYRALEDVAHRF